MKKIVTFGEVMMRLSPSANNKSIKRTEEYKKCFGGSEANVAYTIASYGAPAKFVSFLPSNPLGEEAIYALYHKNLDTETVRFSNKGRLGIYFLEEDYKHFTRNALYYRDGSSFALSKREDYNWEEILKDASLFHFSGITPALSPEMPLICEDACLVAKMMGIPISIDINYRKSLWDKETAKKVMQKLCYYADVLFINEDEFSLLGIEETADALLDDPLKFKKAAQQVCENYSVQTVASARRSASKSWDSLLDIKAMIYQWTNRGFILTVSKTFPIFPIDLNGAGDSFAGGVLYALYCEKMSTKRAINFAAATCALKHQCIGDLNTPNLELIKKFQKR